MGLYQSMLKFVGCDNPYPFKPFKRWPREPDEEVKADLEKITGYWFKKTFKFISWIEFNEVMIPKIK